MPAPQTDEYLMCYGLAPTHTVALKNNKTLQPLQQQSVIQEPVMSYARISQEKVKIKFGTYTARKPKTNKNTPKINIFLDQISGHYSSPGKKEMSFNTNN